MEIKGKVFIVTGGASGLGEGTARMLASAGGLVVIADMQADKGEAVAKDIGGAFVKCDVSNEADGQAVVAKHSKNQANAPPAMFRCVPQDSWLGNTTPTLLTTATSSGLLDRIMRARK